MSENPTAAEYSLTTELYQVALYYCYTPILPSVAAHVKFQQDLCLSLDLKGRIRVSLEGLNGVLSGKRENLLSYQQQVQTELNLEEPIDVKYCDLRADLSVESQLFDSLSVMETREVVSLYEPSSTEAQRRVVDESSKRYHRRRRRNRTKHEQREEVSRSSSTALPVSPHDVRLEGYNPSPHLKPDEWNARLQSHADEAILLDARNVYESRVGHFQVDRIPTLLCNTRKYSSLPQVFQQSKEHLAGKHVYAYCTGGVRCERASVYLQALTESDEWPIELEPPKGIYQLEGGIQRYLEKYGSSSKGSIMAKDDCLYQGKNFVFDPRRTDPTVGKGQVGNCILCKCSHDDYDNGFAPCENKESRCCKCRMLVLVCGDCRATVRSWGEEVQEEEGIPDLYCGGLECIDQGNSVQVEVITRDDSIKEPREEASEQAEEQ